MRARSAARLVLATLLWLGGSGCQALGGLGTQASGETGPTMGSESDSAEVARLKSLVEAATPGDSRRADWLYEIGLLQLARGSKTSQRDALGALNLLANEFPDFRSTEVAALTSVLRELIFLRRKLATAEQQVANRDEEIEAQRNELERQREALRKVTESVMGADEGAAPAPAPDP